MSLIKYPKSASEIVCELRSCDVIGSLKGLIPDGVRIDINKHDTATHCKIFLEIEGEKPLLVWYKTNWVSPDYDFNEKGKVIGVQTDCEFALPILNKLFFDVKAAVDAHKKMVLAAKKDKEEAEEKICMDRISIYRKEFSN